MRILQSILRAAKNTRHPDEPNISGVPRPVVPTIHMGEVTKVDIGRNVLGLKLNDSDETTIDTGVPWIQQFTRDDPPAEGDTVLYVMLGNQPRALGRQVVPDDTVTFE